MQLITIDIEDKQIFILDIFLFNLSIALLMLWNTTIDMNMRTRVL